MPPFKSKKSGGSWNSISEYKAYAAQKDPSIAKLSDEQLMQAIQADPDFEVAGSAPAAIPSTDIPPTENPLLQKAINMGPQDQGYGSYLKNKFLPSLGEEIYSAVAGPFRLAKAAYDGTARAYETTKNEGPVQAAVNAGSGLAEMGSGMYNDVKDFYFGGNFLSNLHNHPGRVAGDAASVLSAGGGLLMKGGKAGSLANRAGSTLTKAANLVDPLTLPLQASKAALRAGGADKWLYKRAFDPYVNKTNISDARMDSMVESGFKHDIPVAPGGDKTIQRNLDAYQAARESGIKGNTTPVPNNDVANLVSKASHDTRQKVGPIAGSEGGLNAIQKEADDILRAERVDAFGNTIPYEGRTQDPVVPGIRTFTFEELYGQMQSLKKQTSDFIQKQRTADPSSLEKSGPVNLFRVNLAQNGSNYIDNALGALPISVPGRAPGSIGFNQAGQEMSKLMDLKKLIRGNTKQPLLDRLSGGTDWGAAQSVKMFTDPSPYSAAFTLHHRVFSPARMSKAGLAIKDTSRTTGQKLVRGGQRAGRVTDDRKELTANDENENSQPSGNESFKRFSDDVKQGGFKRY